MRPLRKILGLALLTAAAMGVPARAQIQPLDLAGVQAQTQSQLNQQNLQTQLNSLQLQQGMTQDRIREQQLFLPQPGMPNYPMPGQSYQYGQAFQPQPPVPPPAPPPERKPEGN